MKKNGPVSLPHICGKISIYSTANVRQRNWTKKINPLQNPSQTVPNQYFLLFLLFLFKNNNVIYFNEQSFPRRDLKVCREQER